MSRNFPGWIQNFLAIAAVMLASGSILILSDWCGSLLGFLACLAIVTSLPHPGNGKRFVRPVAVALLAVAAHTIFRLDSGAHRLLGLSWLFALIHLVECCPAAGCGSDPGSRWLRFHLATLAFAGLLTWYEQSPRLWYITRSACNFTDVSKTSIGVWASSLPVYVLGGLVLAVTSITGAHRHRVVTGLLILCAGYPVGKVVLSMLESIGAHHISIHQLASVAFVSAVVASVELGSATRPERRCMLKHLWLTGASTVAILAFGLRPADIPASPTGACPSRPSFALYSRGMLDWRLPDNEKLGLVSSGMFGLFRESLERRVRETGGEVILIDSLGGHDLSRVGVITFINPTTSLTDGEVSALGDFVTSGGGLLVLGDHTDIGGSRDPLNTLLSFTGIRFNFDSAVPLRKHWHGCLKTRAHETTRGAHDAVMLQTAVGASLEIEEPAFPLVVGRYGFSDAGDYSNAGMGAHMGNGRHEATERVGDLVLVAGQSIGKGRVVTFGDTSPFQNVALFLSRNLVEETIAWLAGGEQRIGPGVSEAPYGGFDYDKAVIDFSLRPEARLELFSATSLGGLANCLARAGVSAAPSLTSNEWTRNAAYLFIVNPTRNPSHRETSWLLDYTSDGGNLIICQGYRSPGHCPGLLSDLGFSVEPVPLGGGDAGSRVRHKDAWWVSYGGEADTSVLATTLGYPTIVKMEMGLGTVTVIGDGKLFLDESLESEFKGTPENTRFVLDLVGNLRDRHEHEIVSGY
ncbi:MAG: hypothetical protein ABIJ00_14285 [Candidatus Eisenbacteria bacterium]